MSNTFIVDWGNFCTEISLINDKFKDNISKMNVALISKHSEFLPLILNNLVDIGLNSNHRKDFVTSYSISAENNNTVRPITKHTNLKSLKEGIYSTFSDIRSSNSYNSLESVVVSGNSRESFLSAINILAMPPINSIVQYANHNFYTGFNDVEVFLLLVDSNIISEIEIDFYNEKLKKHANTIVIPIHKTDVDKEQLVETTKRVHSLLKIDKNRIVHFTLSKEDNSRNSFQENLYNTIDNTLSNSKILKEKISRLSDSLIEKINSVKTKSNLLENKINKYKIYVQEIFSSKSSTEKETQQQQIADKNYMLIVDELKNSFLSKTKAIKSLKGNIENELSKLSIDYKKKVNDETDSNKINELIKSFNKKLEPTIKTFTSSLNDIIIELDKESKLCVESFKINKYKQDDDSVFLKSSLATLVVAPAGYYAAGSIFATTTGWLTTTTIFASGAALTAATIIAPITFLFCIGFWASKEIDKARNKANSLIEDNIKKAKELIKKHFDAATKTCKNIRAENEKRLESLHKIKSKINNKVNEKKGKQQLEIERDYINLNIISYQKELARMKESKKELEKFLEIFNEFTVKYY